MLGDTIGMLNDLQTELNDEEKVTFNTWLQEKVGFLRDLSTERRVAADRHQEAQRQLDTFAINDILNLKNEIKENTRRIKMLNDALNTLREYQAIAFNNTV